MVGNLDCESVVFAVSMEENQNDNSLLPTPEEYGEICSDPKMAAEFHFQIGHMVALCSRLRFCSKCSLVNGDKTVCYCENGCYLQELGLLDNSNISSISALISSLSWFFGRYSALYSGVLEKEANLEKEKQSLESKSKELEDGKEQLEKDEKAFQEKKAKLGRPSDFNNRKFMYEVCWVQANPKPSLRELGKKFDPPLSPMQVSRDLERLGYKVPKSKDK